MTPQRRILTITILLPFILCAAPTTSKPTTQPAPAPATSDWGSPVSGLKSRLTVPAIVEQNDSILAILDLQCDPAALSKGINALDKVVDTFTLTLRNIDSGKSYTILPYNPGMPIFDTGDHSTPLDGKPLAPLNIPPFALRDAKVPPGAYDTTVSLTQKPLNGHDSLWTGTIVSAPLRIKITPEILKPFTFQVPQTLSFDADGKVRYHGTEKIDVMLGNGLTIGTQTEINGQSLSLQSSTPHFEGVETDWKTSPPKGDQVTYTFEVFATPTPAGHMWSPDPTQEGYKTLWKKTFTISTKPPA